jgi:hypothetical protein
LTFSKSSYFKHKIAFKKIEQVLTMTVGTENQQVVVFDLCEH